MGVITSRRDDLHAVRPALHGDLGAASSTDAPSLPS
jgi:hypothetical protein